MKVMTYKPLYHKTDVSGKPIKTINVPKCNKCLYYVEPNEDSTSRFGKCLLFKNSQTAELEYAIDARKYPDMCGPNAFYYDEDIFSYGSGGL
jgi:hypothetical protein